MKKVSVSRNKREGRYAGYLKKHVRQKCTFKISPTSFRAIVLLTAEQFGWATNDFYNFGG